MRARWDDGGAHGLRVVIDLGMQELMCDAERRSLVTQLQLSYADPLRLAVDAVEKAMALPEPSRRSCSSRDDGAATPASQRERASAKADDALGRFDRSPATRLLFSSLSGVFESFLANDRGSTRWAVRRSARRFDEAAAELLGARRETGAVAGEFERDSIVVLSPDADATFALNEPLDTTGTIYVVGGLCDYRRVEGATLRRARAAARRERIRVVAKRLPIAEAFEANASVNILTVNQTVEILSRVARNAGDWRAAFIETLPERKLRELRARGSFAASDDAALDG